MLNHELCQLEQDHRPDLLRDLRQLAFIDCAGLGVIIAANLRARETGSQLKVLCDPGQIERVFTLAGADRLLETSPHPGSGAASDKQTIAV